MCKGHTTLFSSCGCIIPTYTSYCCRLPGYSLPSSSSSSFSSSTSSFSSSSRFSRSPRSHRTATVTHPPCPCPTGPQRILPDTCAAHHPSYLRSRISSDYELLLNECNRRIRETNRALTCVRAALRGREREEEEEYWQIELGILRERRAKLERQKFAKLVDVRRYPTPGLVSWPKPRRAIWDTE